MTKIEVRLVVAARLRKARLETKLTQVEVAATLDVSRQTISAWERGQSQPSLPEFRELAQLYGVSADLLLFGIQTVPLGSHMLAAILGTVKQAETQRHSV
jgi:transcriptional regulator with XRE-family HTH domain